ncbi:MAG: transcription antitermination factor NusB [Terracidiphilus sp.]
MARVSPARRAAFDVLMAVERGHAHSDDRLRGKAVNALAEADRNLATALVLGVLRWQIRLDYQLKEFLKRPGARLDPEVLIALRLGAFQLLFLDRVPAHAAIDESVELAKQAGHRFASGMVNAVLRKLASQAAENPQTVGVLRGHGFSRAESATNKGGALVPAAELALAEAHPAWMVERWTEFYGIEAARAICRHGQSQPAQTVRLANPSVEKELTQAGIELSPGALLAAAHTVVSGDVGSTAAFREGRVRFQDEGSQLIAELTSTNPVRDRGKILDACAAPGGKTLILAERNPQTRIVACEANPRRLAELRERLAAYEGCVECRLADAAELTEEGVFDAALADVPCSGTGTLGRNPEIRHRLRPEDLPRQAERQRAILRTTLRAVRPGGCVVYSTCSLEPEENEQVVAAALADNPHARLVSLEARIEALSSAGVLTEGSADRLRNCITPEGALRLLPGRFGTDGFFVALIEKTAQLAAGAG